MKKSKAWLKDNSSISISTIVLIIVETTLYTYSLQRVSCHFFYFTQTFHCHTRILSKETRLGCFLCGCFFSSTHRRNFAKSKVGETALGTTDSLHVECLVAQQCHFDGRFSPIVSVIVVAGATGRNLSIVQTIQDAVNDRARGLELDAHESTRNGIGNVFKVERLFDGR